MNHTPGPLLEALEKIASYQRPHHSATEEDIASWRACKKCRKNEEKGWPPSRKCDEHYRKLILKPERANQHEEGRTPGVLREIAREAIRKARGE